MALKTVGEGGRSDLRPRKTATSDCVCLRSKPTIFSVKTQGTDGPTDGETTHSTPCFTFSLSTFEILEIDVNEVDSLQLKRLGDQDHLLACVEQFLSVTRSGGADGGAIIVGPKHHA